MADRSPNTPSGVNTTGLPLEPYAAMARAQLLRLDGQRRRPPDRQAAVLAVLMAYEGHPVSTRLLEARAYGPGHCHTPNVVSAIVEQLRRKLRPLGKAIVRERDTYRLCAAEAAPDLPALNVGNSHIEPECREIRHSEVVGNSHHETPRATVARQSLSDLIERERLRTRIEAAVAWLIDALDAIDAPGTDLEDGDDAEAVDEDGCEMGGTDNGIADAEGEEGLYRRREVAHA